MKTLLHKKLSEGRKEDFLIITVFFLLISTLAIYKAKIFINYVPLWDEALHLKNAYNFYLAFSSKNWSYIWQLIRYSGDIYPPFYYFVIDLCYKMFGVSAVAGVIANVPFIFLLEASIYGLGTLVAGRKVGLLAAILTPLLPVFLRLQESVLVDYASVSLFILSYYLAFKTNGFKNRKYSIFFGVSILLNLLTKWPFVVPLLPLFYYFATNIFTRKVTKIQITNVIIILLIATPGILWYVFNYPYFISKLGFLWSQGNYPQIIWNYPHGFTWDNILLYFYTYPAAGSGLGLGVLIFGILALLSKSKFKYRGYFIATIIINYLVLTILSDKEAKYIAYSYPLLMIIILQSTQSIKNIFFKKISVAFLVFLILANFVYAHINFPEHSYFTTKFHINRHLFVVPLLPGYETKFTDDYWPTEKIVYEYFPGNGLFKNVLVLPDHRYINSAVIKYFSEIEGRRVDVFGGTDLYDPARNDIPPLSKLTQYDYILTKTGDEGVFANPVVISYINNYLASSPNYKLLASYAVPDKSYILLYQKVN